MGHRGAETKCCKYMPIGEQSNCRIRTGELTYIDACIHTHLELTHCILAPPDLPYDNQFWLRLLLMGARSTRQAAGKSYPTSKAHENTAQEAPLLLPLNKLSVSLSLIPRESFHFCMWLSVSFPKRD